MITKKVYFKISNGNEKKINYATYKKTRKKYNQNIENVTDNTFAYYTETYSNACKIN